MPQSNLPPPLQSAAALSNQPLSPWSLADLGATVLGHLENLHGSEMLSLQARKKNDVKPFTRIKG